MCHDEPHAPAWASALTVSLMVIVMMALAGISVWLPLGIVGVSSGFLYAGYRLDYARRHK